MRFADLLRQAWFRDAAGIIRYRAEWEGGHKIGYAQLSSWRRGKNLPHDARIIPLLARVLRLDGKELRAAYEKDLSSYPKWSRERFRNRV